jgi:hypothetical protein
MVSPVRKLFEQYQWFGIYSNRISGLERFGKGSVVYIVLNHVGVPDLYRHAYGDKQCIQLQLRYTRLLYLLTVSTSH